MFKVRHEEKKLQWQIPEIFSHVYMTNPKLKPLSNI